MISRRRFIGGMASLCPPIQNIFGALISPDTAAEARNPSTPGRVVILGFDGVEPTIVEGMLSKGELPKLQRLRESGSYHRMLSSNPPQSPTAWSSFATCKNPGGHGIYDFLRRDPTTYMPGLGFGGMEPATLGADGRLLMSAGYKSRRKGETFWSVAANQGVRAKLLWVPYAYPPEDLPGLQILCGLDVPDIRGTQSTYFALSDRLTEPEYVAGGMRIPLVVANEEATANIPGFRHPNTKEYIAVPLRITVDRSHQTLTIDVQGKKHKLSEKRWSDWLEWTFDVAPGFQVHAISKCYVYEAGEHIRLYMTCLQVHPSDPCLPISAPATYAATLSSRHGLFKTVGWSDDTKALQHNDLTEELFLQEALANMAFQGLVVLDEFDAGQFDLFIAGWTSTDRVAHMFWRYSDKEHPKHEADAPERFRRAVETLYAQMDTIVGEIARRLQPNDLLMILSDHGFKSFHTQFSVNTWLVRNGYLAVKDQRDNAEAFTDDKFLQGFDWSRSKAYGLGLGSVFLNLRGREGKGIVPPEDADALLKEIRERLIDVKEPESGKPILHDVYLARDVYRGDCLSEAPDMQLGFRDGFQMNKASASGAAPKNIFSPNDDKWSGEHAAADVHHAHGILFCNRPLLDNPAIVDIGVTALNKLNIDVPQDYEGRPLG